MTQCGESVSPDSIELSYREKIIKLSSHKYKSITLIR